MTGHNTSNHGFRKIQNFQLDYSPCSISQYVSETSGMDVVIVDRQGPKVSGFFALATEVHDNSGSPHTLEHLIFTAAKHYPYKGLLDQLSNRLFSTTNAWTAADQTVYTISSIGEEAFSQILPVYLEHILLPTISDAAVTTEVWNVGSDGKDGGVVYSEMQAIEFGQANQMWRKMSEMMYPEGIGFRYETGGMTGALRTLTPERIRQFHRDMYQPRNLRLVILGQVDHDRLLGVLGTLETKIKADMPPLDSPFKRPWIDSAQPPPLSESRHEVVEFPEEDEESTGEVWIGWFGPSCNDQVGSAALAILVRYMCDSSVSVIEHTLVETEQVASSTFCDCTARPHAVVMLGASGVATNKLDYVRERILEILQEIESKPLDMAYLHDCVRLIRRKIRVAADGFSELLSTLIIGDFVFGDRDGSGLAAFKSLEAYDVVEGWEEQDWKAFLGKYITGAHYAAVTGKPSTSMAAKIKADEEARIARRKEELGEEGLRKEGEKLEAAKAINSKPIPDSVLRQWVTPSTDAIKFIKPNTARAGKAARELGAGQKNKTQERIDAMSQGSHPLFLQFEEVPWKFIKVSLHMTTGTVPTHLLPLIPVFVDNFFKTPVMRDGTKVGYEQIVMEIERDTISYDIDTGNLGDGNSIVLQFCIETDKYANIIERIRSLMFDSVFDVERLKTSVVKLLADVPDLKRSGTSMANQVSENLHLENGSLVKATSDLVAAVYLKRLKNRLEKRPAEVIEWLETLQRSLYTVENIRCLVVGEVAELESPVAEWDVLAKALAPPSGQPMNPIVDTAALRSADGKEPGSLGATIIPMTAIDSSYSFSTAKGILGWQDPRVPALRVTGAYLNMQEGPLHNAVRGQGLAYGTFAYSEWENGVVRFELYRSPDVAKALAASLEAAKKVASGEIELDQLTVEAAISQVVYGFASGQQSPEVAAKQGFLWQVIRGLPSDFVTKQLEAVRKVTADDIRAVFVDFVVPLMQPGTSNIVVTCAKVMQESMEKSLRDMGYKTQTQTLAHYHDDYGLKGIDGEEDDEEEAEEEEEEKGENALGSGDSGSEEEEDEGE